MRLIAEGYYITYITTGALNFGQGEFLMVGALFGLTCYVTLGLPYAIAILAAIALTALMGVGLERVAIRPVMRHALSLELGTEHRRGQHHFEECGGAYLGTGADQVSFAVRSSMSSGSGRRESFHRSCSSSLPRSAP